VERHGHCCAEFRIDRAPPCGGGLAGSASSLLFCSPPWRAVKRYLKCKEARAPTPLIDVATRIPRPKTPLFHTSSILLSGYSVYIVLKKGLLTRPGYYVQHPFVDSSHTRYYYIFLYRAKYIYACYEYYIPRWTSLVPKKRVSRATMTVHTILMARGSVKYRREVKRGVHDDAIQNSCCDGFDCLNKVE
jgi:hypothetical protein